MRWTTIFLFILFLGVNLKAQHKPDSLWKAWSDESLSNEKRIEALTEKVWRDYLFSNPDSGYFYGDLMYRFSKLKNEKQGMLNALNIQAISLTIRGLNQKALSLYKQAEGIAVELNDKELLARMLSNKGIVMIDLYEFDDAIVNFQRSIELCEEAGNQKGIGPALNSIGVVYQKQSNYSEALNYYEKSLEYFIKYGPERDLANTYNSIGEVHHVLGNNQEAFDLLKKALKIRQELTYKIGELKSLLSIGDYYKDLGEYSNAFDYYTKSLKISEEVKDSNSIAHSNQKIARLYHNQGNFEEAIVMYRKSMSLLKACNGNRSILSSTICLMGETINKMGMSDDALAKFNEALKIRQEINDKRGIAECYNNIASLYFQQGDPTLALSYHLKSLEIKKEIGFLKGEAVSLFHIGQVYYCREQYDESLEYYDSALRIFENLNIKNRIGKVHFKIGNVLEQQSQFNDAIKSYSKAKVIQAEIGDLLGLSETLNCLREVLSKINKPSAALKNFEEYVSVKDSLAKIDGIEKEKQRVIHEQYLLKIQSDSIVSANEIKVQHERVHTEQIENEKLTQQKYFLFLLLGVAIIFGGIIFNRFRITNRQKSIIEFQKSQVEEKTEEILDSIQYARRLQEATLPSEKIVREYLPESFILFKPKDIVSGDFYWVEKLEDCVYFAVADCTGHGVPGAMVSVVCSSALTKALIEEGIKNPADILNRTRELVIEKFQRSENEIMDGMDISICACDSKKGQLTWAGANNPLWIIRQKSQEIETLNGDRQPVGIYPFKTPLTSHKIDINKGDTIYLFTDGFVDQFGGEKGKKYKTTNFKNLLIGISSKDISSQSRLLSAEFDQWKGANSQIDDVCVMGVRM